MNCPPSEFAVADLAPAGRAHSSRLAGRIGREIIVEHKVFAVFTFERIDYLLILASPQGRDRQGLRLAAGEQSRTMSTGKYADFCRDRPNRTWVATVDAAGAAQNSAAHDLLFEILEDLERRCTLFFVVEQLAHAEFCRIDQVA